MSCARRPRARPNSDQSIVPAGHFGPLKGDGPDDLCESERQHREIDARQPNAEPAEDQSADETGERSADKPRRHPEMFERQCSAVSAQAEISGMAEGDEAARA